MKRWGARAIDRARRPAFARHWKFAEQVQGWTSRREAIALYEAARALPSQAVIVEIGSFLGRSTIVLAGACADRGNGRVYTVDPFDGSGDEFSRPVYRAIRDRLPSTQFDCCRQNLAVAGATPWVEVLRGTAASASAGWRQPIHLLFLDGDQSPAGMRQAYDSFMPFLAPGGILAVHNSADRTYTADHDGGRKLVAESVKAPLFEQINCVGTTTLAVTKGWSASGLPRVDSNERQIISPGSE